MKGTLYRWIWNLWALVCVGKTVTLTSPSGELSIQLCERCGAFSLHSHEYVLTSLRASRLRDAASRFESVLVQGGYVAAATELRRLVPSFEGVA